MAKKKATTSSSKRGKDLPLRGPDAAKVKGGNQPVMTLKNGGAGVSYKWDIKANKPS